MYHNDAEQYFKSSAGFEEIVLAMNDLITQGWLLVEVFVLVIIDELEILHRKMLLRRMC